MTAYSDRYTHDPAREAERDREWREIMRELHYAFHGKRLHVPTMNDFRLQSPSKPPSDSAIYETVGSLMKKGVIYSACLELLCGANRDFERDYLEPLKDKVWGPETHLWQKCPKCKSSNTQVKYSYSNLPHGERATGVLGVAI